MQKALKCGQESTLKSEALNRELQRVQVEQQLELQAGAVANLGGCL